MRLIVTDDRPGKSNEGGVRRERIAIQRVSTTEAIAKEVTRRILDGTYPAGEYLREVDLSAQFDVSRQSLRAALARLEHLGLLQHEAHRGMRVPIVTKQDLLDIFRIRALLETEAIRHACSHPETWLPIEHALTTMAALPKTARWADLVEADLSIHQRIVDGVGSARLRRAYEIIDAESRLVMVPARFHQTKAMVVREHRALVDVIKGGDAEAAIARFHDHLWSDMDAVLARLPDEPG